MPVVVTFWQLPEEENTLLEYLERTGGIVGLPDHWVKSSDDLTPLAIRLFIQKHDPDQFLFGLEQHLRDVSIERSKYEGVWGYKGPGAMQACLVTYTRPKLYEGRKLALSNLAAYWTCLDEGNSMVIDKDREFVKWGKRVMAWVRKATPEQVECNGYPYRATRQVKEAVESGEIVPVLH